MKDLSLKVKENYNYKRKDNKEEVQEEDERNVILFATRLLMENSWQYFQEEDERNVIL